MTAVPERLKDWNERGSHWGASDRPERIMAPEAWRERAVVASSMAEARDTPDPLDAEIEASREFLSLDDNWDGEGSAGYTESTWRASVALLRDLGRLAREHGLNLPTPRIGAAQEGSFDLHWELSHGSMLMNVESSHGHPCTYYGQASNGSTLAGTLVRPNNLAFILAWLAAP